MNSSGEFPGPLMSEAMSEAAVPETTATPAAPTATYADVGARVARIITAAEEASAEIRADALAGAEQIRPRPATGPTVTSPSGRSTASGSWPRPRKERAASRARPTHMRPSVATTPRRRPSVSSPRPRRRRSSMCRQPSARPTGSPRSRGFVSRSSSERPRRWRRAGRLSSTSCATSPRSSSRSSERPPEPATPGGANGDAAGDLSIPQFGPTLRSRCRWREELERWTDGSAIQGRSKQW